MWVFLSLYGTDSTEKSPAPIHIFSSQPVLARASACNAQKWPLLTAQELLHTFLIFYCFPCDYSSYPSSISICKALLSSASSCTTVVLLTPQWPWTTQSSQEASKHGVLCHTGHCPIPSCIPLCNSCSALRLWNLSSFRGAFPHFTSSHPPLSSRTYLHMCLSHPQGDQECSSNQSTQCFVDSP